MKLCAIKPIIINERIYSENGDLIITIQREKDTSDKTQISTYTRRQPYETHVKGVGEALVYSVYNYVSSPEITNLLSSLKGKGPYRVNKKQYDTLLSSATEAVEPVFSRHKPDVIIYPKSSSTLVSDFVKKLREKYPDADVVPDSFVKRVLDAGDVEPLLNTHHPDWKKFSEENPDDVKKLKRSLSKMISDNGGELELKKLFKPYLKFVKNFVKMEDEYKILDKVLEKNVLVVDDVLSSGATMIEMVRQLAEYEPSSISGLTIFKHTTVKSL